MATVRLLGVVTVIWFVQKQPFIGDWAKDFPPFFTTQQYLGKEMIFILFVDLVSDNILQMALGSDLLRKFGEEYKIY